MFLEGGRPVTGFSFGHGVLRERKGCERLREYIGSIPVRRAPEQGLILHRNNARHEAMH
jgi:hypothetical protein